MNAATREPADFGSLYYTDCLPGQGLAGTGGLQFQARSVHLDDDDAARRTVAHGGLYEVPTRWMRDQRPVADFPRSLAHLVEDDLVTTAGCYLGKEAKGYRDGNQFTHAVVTRDPSSYGSLRPAQLWSAPWWADRPAPTTTCPGVEAPPEPGPWDTETVRDHVRADPQGSERLLALVSAVGAVHGADRRRVLIVAADPGEAAAWVAAATLLLDRERALSVSFKIFTTDPDRTPHDVLAVHPDWAAPHDRSGDYVVLDLRGASVPTVGIDDHAAFWVPRFLEGDPLDVVDAVELAGQLARETGVGTPGQVERAAAALALGVDEPAGPAVGDVVRWLGGVHVWVVDLLGVPLVETLARTEDHAVLAAVDTATAARAAAPGATDLGWVETAVAVRRRLLEHEVGAARVGHAVRITTQVVPVRGALRPEEDTAAVAVVVDSDPPAGMALAHRYALPPSTSMVWTFARWWADHPDQAPPVRSWACEEQVCDALFRELNTRLGDSGRRAATAADIGRRWWGDPWEVWRVLPLLDDRGPYDGVHPIDVEVARAAFDRRGEPRETALRSLAEVLTGPANERWLRTWHLVVGRSSPVSPIAVRRFLDAVPRTALTEGVARQAYGALSAAPGFGTDAQRAVVVLEEAGWPPEKLDIKDYPPSDEAVTEVVERLLAGARADDVRALSERLSDASHPTRPDRARLTRAVLEAPPVVAAPVLRGRSRLRKDVREAVEGHATGNRDRRPDPRALALVVTWLLVDPIDRADADDVFLQVLRPWCAALRDLGDGGRQAAFRHLGQSAAGSPYADVRRLFALWLQAEGLPGPAGPGRARAGDTQAQEGHGEARPPASKDPGRGSWLSGFRRRG